MKLNQEQSSSYIIIDKNEKSVSDNDIIERNVKTYDFSHQQDMTDLGSTMVGASVLLAKFDDEMIIYGKGVIISKNHTTLDIIMTSKVSLNVNPVVINISSLKGNLNESIDNEVTIHKLNRKQYSQLNEQFNVLFSTPTRYFLVEYQKKEFFLGKEIRPGSVLLPSNNEVYHLVDEVLKKILPADEIIFFESDDEMIFNATGFFTHGIKYLNGPLKREYKKSIGLLLEKYFKGVTLETMLINQNLKDNLKQMSETSNKIIQINKKQFNHIDEEIKKTFLLNEQKVTTNIQRNYNSINFNEPKKLGDKLVLVDKDIIEKQIENAFKQEKHIILIGPPGTGKSKLAEEIINKYDAKSKMVTASSNWSTYDTIGGYMPDQTGSLYFNPGLILECFKDTQSPVKNQWLVIDELNRADIDKAFGSLFSVFAGDEVELPYKNNGENIKIIPENKSDKINDSIFLVPKDWRLIGTLNTIDKASLYEMSYAFMRRFAFIPINVPKEINEDLIKKYMMAWGYENYPYRDELKNLWNLTNKYRMVGPAIIEDVLKFTNETKDFTSAIIMFILPQFEGVNTQKINDFINEANDTIADMDKVRLNSFVYDFFDRGF